MKKIAIFCVSYLSDNERDSYLASIDIAAKKAQGDVNVEVFVANNNKENNPGYFGAIKKLMQNVDMNAYDYAIISNVDLTLDEDFFVKLAAYNCAEDTGWIAPSIWSRLEKRDRNPARTERPSYNKMVILKSFYQYPILDTIYHKTAYRRKKYNVKATAGTIYAGHGSLIILTKQYFKRCGKIDYPIFLFCEELYLAESCRQAGLTVEYEPSIVVYDKEHVSIGKMPHSLYCKYNLKAMKYIIEKFFLLLAFAFLLTACMKYDNPIPIPTPVPDDIEPTDTDIVEPTYVLELPSVNIETVNGEELTCDFVSAPEGSLGQSIKNANKVGAKIVIAQNEQTIYNSGDYIENESGTTIKIRGNSSAYKRKKGYKLKLQKKADLLGRNDSRYEDKEWVLVTDERTSLNTLIGTKVSQLLGLPWTPAFKFVNLELNGDPRGLYLLMESVKRKETRLDISKDGYIIELDPYWWNEDVYFETRMTETPEVKYTFKYPDSKDITPEQLAYIKGYMNDMEDALIDWNHYQDYVDVESFAAWVLAQDILGNFDGFGSNIFMTKYDNTSNSKLKMGNLWDFDAIMKTPGEWSESHRYPLFVRMLTNGTDTSMATTYERLWNTHKDSLFIKLYAYLDSIASSEEGEMLNQAFRADSERWGRDILTIEETIERAKAWFEERKVWLQKAIESKKWI